ncbi:hypothetical protein CN221_37565 [Sinorhizobium meliloti]|nr:hypothetical protein [Sinorhizobium meliloti]RVG80251.1 hypothetical protein CN221_37565 [Sinorhizobium meliloti]RVH50463.1 hypothetical protein CN209_38385 [Sinorhizobium meliloti]RVI19392.1 hypothetical protein CN207_35425 [Sinorhizobium meliloti]RVL89873.1 hypothetical protein CN142_37890 [Sinorhizobium meliloti]
MSASVADLTLFLTRWPVVDAIVGAFWFRSVWATWRGCQPPGTRDDVDERNLGASVILAQLNGAITSASIIVAGVGAFVALTPTALDPYTLAFLRLAAAFSVAALGSAVYALATLPTRAPSVNLVRSKEVAILSTVPLIFVTFAGIRFMCAIWAFLS